MPPSPVQSRWGAVLGQGSSADEDVPKELQTPLPMQAWAEIAEIERPQTVPRRTSIQGPLIDNKAHTDLELRLAGEETALSSPQIEGVIAPAVTDARPAPAPSRLGLSDLPLEVRERIVDFISGEMHSVTATSSQRLSSSMRHPRRKAVSDLALVSPDLRDVVQERIFRHIKIKGTRAGLAEAEDFFADHSHLTRHVRHIEVWVPVWGDRTSIDPLANPVDNGLGPPPRLNFGANETRALEASDTNVSFKRSVDSATLEEIFTLIQQFFPSTCIFTLEGGHCKKSHMIAAFRGLRFHNRLLPTLSQIRTFAMRGAWNIMRCYSDWELIQEALPNVQEWHCSYAKPSYHAYRTVDDILLQLPLDLRHVNVSLEGMYSKDPSPTLGSTGNMTPHLCEELGRVAPYLESLSYTGKICSDFWHAAKESHRASRQKEPRLQNLELVVKSCCRERVESLDPETGETIIEEIGGVMADGAGIMNPVFIRAFERLVLATVESLDKFSVLEVVKVRFIDLDSPCAQLNPYWILRAGKIYGVWSEEILASLQDSVRGRSGHVGYVELEDGINHSGLARKEEGLIGAGVQALYPKTKPRTIKTSTYRLVADARGS